MVSILSVPARPSTSAKNKEPATLPAWQRKPQAAKLRVSNDFVSGNDPNDGLDECGGVSEGGEHEGDEHTQARNSPLKNGKRLDSKVSKSILFFERTMNVCLCCLLSGTCKD